MQPSQLLFQEVTFKYSDSPENLFIAVSFHITNGWYGMIGANGSGKSTLLKLAAGLLEPVVGTISRPGHSLYCPQRTDDPPELASEFIHDNGKISRILKNQLQIDDEHLSRWHTLSHGERKRLQLAVALWRQPDLLAIDEPTNHLDSEGRDMIIKALTSYQGIGLLVSHDRELLDWLCQACFSPSPPAVYFKPAGATQTMTILEQEKNAVQRHRDQIRKELGRLQDESVRRREQAQQADRKRSKRHLDRKDHDGRAKIDAGRVSGKDGRAGKLLRQMQGRLNQMAEQVAEIKPEKSYTLGIWLPGSGSKRDLLLRMPTGILQLGGDKKLEYPELVVKPSDRIAITGRNGSGKSSLINALVRRLNVAPPQITYLPQEVDRHTSKAILEETLSLPKPQLGQVMTIVSRLGSRPERLLSSKEPSPGEIRKLLLALGMSREPHIIIMDEPTNHLDLPSIKCLEEALTMCPCALMLVSHDRYFLRRLTTINWELTLAENGVSFLCKIKTLT